MNFSCWPITSGTTPLVFSPKHIWHAYESPLKYDLCAFETRWWTGMFYLSKWILIAPVPRFGHLQEKYLQNKHYRSPNHPHTLSHTVDKLLYLLCTTKKTSNWFVFVIQHCIYYARHDVLLQIAYSHTICAWVWEHVTCKKIYFDQHSLHSIQPKCKYKTNGLLLYYICRLIYRGSCATNTNDKSYFESTKT